MYRIMVIDEGIVCWLWNGGITLLRKKKDVFKRIDHAKRAVAVARAKGLIRQNEEVFICREV